jgi:coenzyme F420 hydrogenase subunit beta
MKNIDRKYLSIAFTNKDLCTRGGTCIGVCPEDALSLDENFYPKLDSDKCTECGICAKTCPGAKVNYKDLTQITFGYDTDSNSFDGHVLQTYVGYAADERLRGGGAGGGVITALLWNLMKQGVVDGCIVTRMNKKKPWIGEYFIARSYDELLESQGSRYMIIPVNSVFQNIRRLPGKYAYAPLPCQVHGFRLAAEENPDLKEKIYAAIGLFCGGSLEPFVVTELLRTKGLSPQDIKDFQFRGGEWPGKMRAILKSDEIVDLHYSNYKDGAYNYLIGLYMPKRCQTCLDGSGEFADLAISDAWTKDKEGKYKFNAHSKILIRTAKGLQIFNNACKNGIIIAQDVTKDPSYRTHKIQTKRKGINAPLRVARLLKKGKAAPIYDRPVPTATYKAKLLERIISFLLFCGKYKYFRFPLIKFLTSKYAIPLIKLRLYLKRRKYQK